MKLLLVPDLFSLLLMQINIHGNAFFFVLGLHAYVNDNLEYLAFHVPDPKLQSSLFALHSIIHSLGLCPFPYIKQPLSDQDTSS